MSLTFDWNGEINVTGKLKQNGQDIAEQFAEAKNDSLVFHSTVGFQSKNILKNFTAATTKESAGITYEISDDGTVVCNGTTTSAHSYCYLGGYFEVAEENSFVLSGCPLGGSEQKYALQVYKKSTPNDTIEINEYGNGYTKTLAKGVYQGIIVIRANQTVENLTFKPMLRLSGTDSNYTPYVPNIVDRLDNKLGKTETAAAAVLDGAGGNIADQFAEIYGLETANTTDIEQNKSDILSAENGIAVNRYTLGTQCKNIINNNRISGTSGGLTITVNEDKSVTFNGTATEMVYYWVYGTGISESNQKKLPRGTYILTGCPKGGTQETYSLAIGYRQYPTSERYSGHDIGNGYALTMNSDTGSVDILIQIRTGTIVDNLTFYPMLRSADITDDSYEPYVPSLQEQIDDNKTAIEQNKGLFLIAGGGITEKTVTYDATVPHGSSKAHTGALLVTLYDWNTNTTRKENLYLVSWNGGIAYTRVQPILESNTSLSLISATGENGAITLTVNASGCSITPLHAGTLVTQ